GAHDAFSVAPDPVDTADVHRDGLRLAAVGVFLVPAQRDGQVGPGEGAGGELAAVAGDDAFDGEGAFPWGGLPGVVHAVVVRLVGLVVVHVGACRVGFSLGGVAALQFAFFVDDGPRRVGTAVRVVLHRAVHGASFVCGRGDCGRSQRHDRSGGVLLPVLRPHGDERSPAACAALAVDVAAGGVGAACVGEVGVAGAVVVAAGLARV